MIDSLTFPWGQHHNLHWAVVDPEKDKKKIDWTKFRNDY